MPSTPGGSARGAGGGVSERAGGGVSERAGGGVSDGAAAFEVSSAARRSRSAAVRGSPGRTSSTVSSTSRASSRSPWSRKKLASFSSSVTGPLSSGAPRVAGRTGAGAGGGVWRGGGGGGGTSTEGVPARGKPPLVPAVAIRSVVRGPAGAGGTGAVERATAPLGAGGGGGAAAAGAGAGRRYAA